MTVETTVPFRKIKAISVNDLVVMRDPQATVHIGRRLLTQMVDRLMEEDAVTFTFGEPDDRFCVKVAATLGIVDPDGMKTMHERVAEHQEAFAAEVVEEIVYQINNWGSHYGYTNIDKDTASRFAWDALQRKLKERQLLTRC